MDSLCEFLPIIYFGQKLQFGQNIDVTWVTIRLTSFFETSMQN